MFDLLLSVVVVVCNEEDRIARRLEFLAKEIGNLAPDYEIVVVDNASSDATVAALDDLSKRLPNLQVFCLSTLASIDGAAVAGLEQSVGDLVVVVESLDWDLSAIPSMVERALQNHDIVFATGEQASVAERPMRYRFLSSLFVRLYRWLTGVDLRADLPRFRLISRRVANFVLQHRSPDLVYQVVPRMAGFRRAYVASHSPTGEVGSPGLLASLSRAVGLLVATSILPIRITSIACLFTAVLSVTYSLYVVIIYLTQENLAPGWTTLSLQLSVTFFLLSMALGVLSEYVIYIVSLTSRPPRYHIAREFQSNVISHKQKLNVLLADVAKARVESPDPPESV